VSIDGEYSGKIFDTDLSVIAAIYIQWCLPGLGSSVIVTLEGRKLGRWQCRMMECDGVAADEQGWL
jgi:hypothetical protein